MANMGYCKFRNTLNDLEECMAALEDGEISSEVEKMAAKQILLRVLEFCENERIIDKFDEIIVDEVVTECEGDE